MNKSNYKEWCDWHLNGRPEMDWDSETLVEMQANEFAMHLLVPQGAVKKLAYENGGLLNLISSMSNIVKFAKMFDVSEEVFYFQVTNMLEDEDNINLEREIKEGFIQRLIRKVFRNTNK